MENSPQEYSHSENILDGMEVNLYQAKSGARFSNWLIDRIVLYLLWRFLIWRFTTPVFLLLGIYDQSRVTIAFVTLAYTLLFDLLFITAFEGFTGGKTLGKFITRTRAVNNDGTRITLKTAFMRSLCRIVPFEVFSALGDPCYPWHDRWTHTGVIDERISVLPNPPAYR